MYSCDKMKTGWKTLRKKWRSFCETDENGQTLEYT